MDSRASQPAPGGKPSEFLLTSLLEQVSRSFYLTLRFLPSSVRPQISLAYLLARATDTIADTGLVPMSQRLEALRALRGRILGERPGPLDLGELLRHQALPAEKMLLERAEEILDLLGQFARADQRHIRDVLATITSGQEMDLLRFAEAGPDRTIALRTEPELDDYTYRVAGCVGEFWTRVCRAHLFPQAPLDEPALLANAVRFGKGLQLVNILRDLAQDLQQGRCYVPADSLAAHGLAAADLRDPANEARLRPLYDSYLRRAGDHLAAGWAYTNALPRECGRVRLACAWPLLVGAKTLARMRMGNVLDARQRIKIRRHEVRMLIVRSVLCYPWRKAWDRLFEAARK